MAQFHLLAATMTGNAQMVAEEIQYVLDEAGHETTLRAMDSLTPEVFDEPGRFIVCTSTYGSGDVPDNAKALYEALCGARPDLSRVSFAIFGLGDSTYQQTYNFGGKKFESILTELGAKAFFEAHFHNASGGTLPEEDCVPWAHSLLALDSLALEAAGA